VSRITFAAMTAVAVGVAFAFLLLPLVAIFLRVPIGDLVDQFGSQVFRDALVVSLKTSLIAHVAVLVFGTPTAYLLARKRFLGRCALITLIELPLVLPPAVAGIALLAAFGRFGLLGDELDALGIQIGFTQTAVPFVRQERHAGVTKYPLRKMPRFSFDAITSFSSAPLQWATILGFIFSVVAFLAIPLTVVARYANIFERGVPTTIIIVLLIIILIVAIAD